MNFLTTYKDNIIIAVVVFLGVLLATVLAWAISSMLTNQYPTLASPYLPTIVAFILGFTVDKFPIIMEKVSEKIMNKVQ